MITTNLWDRHGQNIIPRWVNEYAKAKVILSDGTNYELLTLLALVFLVIGRRCEFCCMMVTHSDWVAMCLSTYLLLIKNPYIEKFLKFAQWIIIIRCVYSVIFRVQVTHSSQLQIVNKQFTPE